MNVVLSAKRGSPESDCECGRLMDGLMKNHHGLLTYISDGDDTNNVNFKFSNMFSPQQLISMVERKESKIARLAGDIIVIDATNGCFSLDGDGALANKTIYNALLLKKPVVVIHADEEFYGRVLDKSQPNMISLVNAFEEINLSKCNENHEKIILRDDFYQHVVLKSMGGNKELNGYNKYDGRCLLVSSSANAINTIISELSAVKDILTLDVDLENIFSFCNNCAMPQAERLNLAALMVDHPRTESSQMVDDKTGVVEKGYCKLSEVQYRDLFDHLNKAGYPFIIAMQLKSWKEIPSYVLCASTHVVVVMQNSMFLRVVKERYCG